jgi:hypothetical protein
MADVRCDHCGQPLGDWAGSSPCCGSTVSDAEGNMVLYGKVTNVNETEVGGFVADNLEKINEVVAEKQAKEN